VETGKQYRVFAPDGLPFGYFLDGRLYEYLTSTCIGFLNDSGQLIDENNVLGRMDGDQLTMNDGTRLTIQTL
jgi:hypothetical protein